MVGRSISIIIPCYNEENYLGGCLDSLIDNYVLNNAEILIMDGMSTDGTRSIVGKYKRKYRNIRLVDNPHQHQSYGLNLGIKKSRGDIIVRIDAHAKYPKRYVRRCVELLKNTNADNVGGVMRAKGKTRFQKLVALAMRHPVGVGDAKFHLGNYSGYTDTVYLGTFRKSIFRKLGYFDPYTNQDAEFNLRILKAGGKIYLDSSIKVKYFPRGSLGKFVGQYFNYGKGRCRTTLKHRRFTSLRQLVPICLVLGLLGFTVLSLVLNPVFLIFPLLYFILILAVCYATLRKEGGRVGDMFLLSVVFVSMHVSWGCGFLAKLLGVVK